MNIIAVCTGNTCRSPMAEAFIKEKFPDKSVASRGLYVAAPSAASENARKAMEEYGLDISAHISRQLDEKEVREAQLVLTMTAGHRDRILAVIPEARGKVFMLSEYSGTGGDISDPFGGNMEDYRRCAADIKKCVDGLKL